MIPSGMAASFHPSSGVCPALAMPCRQATSPTPQPHLTWACSAFPREVPCPKRGIKRPPTPNRRVVLHSSMAVGVMSEAGLCVSARNAVFDHADQPGWLLGSSPSSFCRSGKAPDPGSAPVRSLTDIQSQNPCKQGTAPPLPRLPGGSHPLP
ncbi:hypothetical protein BT67DRAFT_138699 [Trichocladium antarcticum]|uniref:Uncharacterized protein n=1 Tax=Trichocladium antarcticum TaxID=1450529 RepID=A0AAN6ZBA2_9PEZI|nr:hypothetical protein BT67DRAFT_138699 [Trichocladium antarcticum]